MPNPNPETPPPSANSPGQPWAQIGLLSLNVALLMVGLGDLLFWMGIPFRETTQTMSGLLFLAGLTIYVMSPKRREGQETVPYSLRLHWLNLGTFGGAVTMTLLSLIIPAAQAAQRAAEDREGNRNRNEPRHVAHGPLGKKRICRGHSAELGGIQGPDPESERCVPDRRGQ